MKKLLEPSKNRTFCVELRDAILKTPNSFFNGIQALKGIINNI